MSVRDGLFKLGTGIHRGLFRLTRGRFLGTLGGMPVLILTTTGRKTGRKRSTVVTAPVHDGERVVLVASFGGDDRNPTWFLNLRQDPDVTVTMAGRDRPMRARIAGLEEKAALWPRIVAAYQGYAAYQEKTRRQIPVVILEPAGGPTTG